MQEQGKDGGGGSCEEGEMVKLQTGVTVKHLEGGKKEKEKKEPEQLFESHPADH